MGTGGAGIIVPNTVAGAVVKWVAAMGIGGAGIVAVANTEVDVRVCKLVKVLVTLTMVGSSCGRKFEFAMQRSGEVGGTC